MEAEEKMWPVLGAAGGDGAQEVRAGLLGRMACRVRSTITKEW